MNKFFFMAVLSANLQGVPRVQFNTITAMNTRNIAAADLTRIQNAGAQMVQQQEVEFDDLVIHNIFFLGEMTEEEFVANTQLREALVEGREADAPSEESPTLDEALEHVQEGVAASLADTPAEAEALAEDAEPAPLIGTGNDLSELDAQSVEATPVDDVTTADVKTEE
jgi:hypothetical protein